MNQKEAHIRLDHVDMYYPSAIYNARTLKEDIISRLKLQKSKPMLKDVHALKDFSLNIQEGDRLGVIGHNGSGKSTLLKVIAGIYPVDHGTVDVSGKIHALFDIGLGFDPEASGRDNILYRGLLMGSKPEEIAEKTPEIVEFSGLGDFIDYPLKSYSTGMMVRLAFSVSTSLTGEVLLLDEVLSAGDISFVGKARDRMLKVIDKAKVMVFVTHELPSMVEVCNRAIVLDHGRIVLEDNPAEAVRYYKAMMQVR
ncbi:MAG: ABC transporter ATP-binding protein [Clostridia bacterium]|nr:ABC transporter ATP-binding protein [Clostridia bacterium]